MLASTKRGCGSMAMLARSALLGSESYGPDPLFLTVSFLHRPCGPLYRYLFALCR